MSNTNFHDEQQAYTWMSACVHVCAHITFQLPLHLFMTLYVRLFFCQCICYICVCIGVCVFRCFSVGMFVTMSRCSWDIFSVVFWLWANEFLYNNKRYTKWSLVLSLFTCSTACLFLLLLLLPQFYVLLLSLLYLIFMDTVAYINLYIKEEMYFGFFSCLSH